ncbi:hypothetical protein F5B18DRAFT_43703 [Nemania serpens]|nr:hypothetical protein F5B18DRAFT_43703 [Nemania serpens]
MLLPIPYKALRPILYPFLSLFILAVTSSQKSSSLGCKVGMLAESKPSAKLILVSCDKLSIHNGSLIRADVKPSVVITAADEH